MLAFLQPRDQLQSLNVVFTKRVPLFLTSGWRGISYGSRHTKKALFRHPALCLWGKWLPQRCTFHQVFATSAAVLAHIQWSSANKINSKHRLTFTRIWKFQHSQVWPHNVNRHSCMNARSHKSSNSSGAYGDVSRQTKFCTLFLAMLLSFLRSLNTLVFENNRDRALFLFRFLKLHFSRKKHSSQSFFA